jgi:hypothetical protein
MARVERYGDCHSLKASTNPRLVKSPGVSGEVGGFRWGGNNSPPDCYNAEANVECAGWQTVLCKGKPAWGVQGNRSPGITCSLELHQKNANASVPIDMIAVLVQPLHPYPPGWDWSFLLLIPKCSFWN